MLQQYILLCPDMAFAIDWAQNIKSLSLSPSEGCARIYGVVSGTAKLKLFVPRGRTEGQGSGVNEQSPHLETLRRLVSKGALFTPVNDFLMTA